MKTTFKLASAALLTLALVGCESKILPLGPFDEVGGGDKAELTLSGKAQVPQLVKAEQEALASGFGVGIFVVDKTSGESLATASMLSNDLYTADGSGGLTGAGTVELTMGFHYDVYGYAPYAGTLAAGATTLAVGHDVDFIWAQAMDEVPNTEVHATDLVFDHKTAQIQFKVEGGGDVDITGYTFTVKGFYGSGTANLETGVITPGTIDDNIVVSAVDEPVCFIVPTTGRSTLDVVVSVGGEEYRGTISATFVAGRSYIYTITASDEETFELGFTGTEESWVEENGTVNANE